MPEDPFEGREYVEFLTFEGQWVSLHRHTWIRKVRKHWKQNLEHNFDKIGLTLSDPDRVVRSRQWLNSLLYFKRFSHFQAGERTEVPAGDLPYLLVAVKGGWIVQSFYRVTRISQGERVWPR